MRTTLSRRSFMGGVLAAGAAPLFLPSRLFGAEAPSNLLTLGCIGVGRMGTGNMKQAISRGKNARARVVAVCDVDGRRVDNARNQAMAMNREIWGEDGAFDVQAYPDYRALLNREDLDGVIISTPEHWHALCAIHAAQAGKGIYVEKPLTYTMREGRMLVSAVRKNKVVLQVGSQQRSSTHFHRACWLVRNGRIGRIKEVVVQTPRDSGTADRTPMPVPPQLDYERWMGPTSEEPYTENRVHPQNGFGRPGWLQIQKHCLGMITGWGSHMFDIAQWGLGADLDGGPVEISAKGEFPDRGLFDVHTNYHGEALYANGIRMLSKTDKAGVRFVGEDGWIWVERGAFEAHNPDILRERPEGGIELKTSNNHMDNFLNCLRTGEDPVAPVEAGHRTNTICVLHHIAMKLGRKIRWNPVKEEIEGDPEAAAMLHYPYRDGYVLPG